MPLAYTGYKVQAQKDDGTIFKKYGYQLEGSSILSGITYDYTCNGLETTSAVSRILPVSVQTDFAVQAMFRMCVLIICPMLPVSMFQKFLARRITSLRPD